MKKFKTLWYTGLTIVGIPSILVVIGVVAYFAKNTTSFSTIPDEEINTPKPDTVIVVEKVIVTDTVVKYVQPKPQSVVKDTL